MKNTDREIWRGKSRADFGDPDRFYADSLSVPAGDVEALTIHCGGFAITKPIREWHGLALAAEPTAPGGTIGLDGDTKRVCNHPDCGNDWPCEVHKDMNKGARTTAPASGQAEWDARELGAAPMSTLEDIVKRVPCTYHDVRGRQGHDKDCIHCALEAYAAEDRRLRDGLEKLKSRFANYIPEWQEAIDEPDDDHELGWFRGRKDLAEDFVKELSALLDGKG